MIQSSQLLRSVRLLEEQSSAYLGAQHAPLVSGETNNPAHSAPSTDDARIARVGSQLLLTENAEEITRRAIGALQSTFPTAMGTLYLLDEKSNRLVVAARTQESDAQGKKGHKKAANPLRTGHLETRYRPATAFKRRRGTSYLTQPLLVDGQFLGAVDIAARHEQSFSERDRQALETLCVYIAAAFRNARAHARARSLATLMKERETEIKQLRADLASREAALAEVQAREQQTARFLSTVSHEVRTPLAVIRLHTENMQAYADRISPEQRRTFLRDIEEQVCELSQMNDDLLNFARLDRLSGQLSTTTFDATDIVEEIVQQTASLADRGEVRVRVAMPVALEVTADRAQFRHLVRNLIGNAIKFTDAGGEVQCELTAAEGWLTLSVSDSGIGIPEEDLPRIFDRFHRGGNALAQKVPGSGQGLAIVKHVVEAHGGSITVSSREGVGTTFRARLPIVAR